ncbi:MAG: hypothetical protein OXI69_15560 [Acidobacteriota bacterium]|nr:hypothetical protein [Acidobacteriota bacterium]
MIKRLFNPITVPNAAARLGNYSVPAGKRIDGFELLVCNASGAAVGLDLWIGAAASDTTKLFDRRSDKMQIPAKGVTVISSRQVLDAGFGLWAAASAAGALTLHASGVEIAAAGAVPRRLWTSVGVGVGGADRYTVPALHTLINPEIAVLNRGNAAVNFSGWLVPSGGSAAGSNYFAPAMPVEPGATVTFSLRQVLHAGDKIRVLASAGSALTIHGSGYEITQ